MHQVIGQKIRFSLGYDFKVEEVAAAVENPYFEGGQGPSYQGEAGASGSGSGSGSGLGPTSTDWVWWSEKVSGTAKQTGLTHGTHLKVARIRIGFIATERESTLSKMLTGRLCGSESAARIGCD